MKILNCLNFRFGSIKPFLTNTNKPFQTLEKIKSQVNLALLIGTDSY